MPKKQKQKIPQEVKTLIDEFAKSLSTFDSKVPLPSAIGYLLETLGYPGSPEINPVVVAGKSAEKLIVIMVLGSLLMSGFPILGRVYTVAEYLVSVTGFFFSQFLVRR